MKKQITYAMTMAAGLLVLASCTDKYEYDGVGTWDAAQGYQQIYFPKSSAVLELDPVDPTTATFQIARRVEHKYTYGKDSEGNDSIIADEIISELPAKEVKLDVVANPENVFTVSTPTFAQGDSVATVTVNFPNAVVGTPYTLQVTVTDPEYVSQYSTDTRYSLTVTRVKWNDVGYYIDESGNKVEGWGLYTDVVCGSWFGGDNLTFPTRIQERDDLKGYYRLVNTYDYHYPYNDPETEIGLDWQGEGTTREDCFDYSNTYYIFIDATDPDKVFIPQLCDLGTDWGYGNFRIHSYAGYLLSRGNATAAEDYYGKLENGAITFPEGAILRSMANYQNGGLYIAGSGEFKLVLDPSLDLYTATVNDYRWNLLYKGLFSSEKLDTKKMGVTIYKGKANPDVEAVQPGCFERDAKANGVPYWIINPYEDGSQLVFYVKGDQISVPSGFELQPTGIKALGDDVYARINGGRSNFISEEEIELSITFQTAPDKDGNFVEYGTTTETIANFAPTVDMVLGKFTYLGVYANDGKTYNLGDFSIELDETRENGLVLKDFYLEGSEVPATYDLDNLKVYVDNLTYIGIEAEDGVDYAVYTYNKNGNAPISFDINFDGTLTSTDLILVGSPDGQNLYYWFNATSTTFVPASASARAASTLAGQKLTRHRGAKLNAKLK